MNSRREFVYLVLTGIFVTNAILGELLGGKLFELPFYLPFLETRPVASIGVIPWPVVFVITDLVNEYFGRKGVRQLTFVTVGLIIFAFVVLFAAINIPAASFSPVSDSAFSEVFGQSMWIIVGSIVAFMTSQLVDVFVFWFFKQRTGDRLLWLRATGSTAVSQLIDTFVILAIAFWLPGKISTTEFLSLSATNYSYKLLIAIAMTPVIYGAHALIDAYLSKDSVHHRA